MANPKFVWKGAEEKRAVMEGMWRSLSAASIYLSNQVKADISQAGTLRYAVPKKSGKPSKRTKTIYNFTHSRPGNPPYKQSGRLRGSITWELAGAWRNRGRVGTNVVYGRALEKGYPPRKLAARPYLVPALWKHQAALKAILTRKIKPGGLPPIASNQSRSGVLGRGAKRAGY